MEKHILKKLAWLYVACAMVMPVVVLTGCSDDDDDGGNASAETLSEVSAFTGTDGSTLYLTKVYRGSETYLYIEYDEDNNNIMTSWEDEHYEYELTSESPLQYTDNDDDYTQLYYDFNTNSSGYLKSFKWKTYDDECSCTESFSFSYNSKGQLTKITTRYSDVEYENGDKWTESGGTTIKITWEDDLITEAERSYSWSDSDGCSGESSQTYEYSYGSYTYENATLQYPAGNTEIFEYLVLGTDITNNCPPFLYIGWLGIGPKYLPTSRICSYSYWEDYDGEEDSDEGSYKNSYSYTFNSNGSLYKCGSDYYSYLDDESTEKSLSITEQNETETLKNSHKTRISNRLRNRLRHTSTEE